MSTQFTNDVIEGRKESQAKISKSDSNTQIVALHSLEQENSTGTAGAAGGGKKSKNSKQSSQKRLRGDRPNRGGKKGNELSKTWREIVTSHLCLLFFLPVNKIFQLSFVKEWLKVVGDDDKEKDKQEKSIDNLKQIIKNGKKTLGQWTYENAVYSILYDLKCDEVEAIRYYLCAKDKVPNLINYQFCASGFDDMSTLLHRSATLGYLRYTKILVKHGAKLDTVNKFDNMPIELAQDNVREYLKLCKMGGTTREQIEGSSLDIRKQNSTIDTFFDYLGIGVTTTATGDKEKKDNSDTSAVAGVVKLSKEEIAQGHVALEVICKTVLQLLKHRMPISDDLMLIVWKYLHERESKCSIEENRIDKELINSCRLALRHDNPCKSRDYFWFKTYVLGSNIWLQKIQETENQNEKEKEKESKQIAQIATTDSTVTTTEKKEEVKKEKQEKGAKTTTHKGKTKKDEKNEQTKQQKLMGEILGDISPDPVLFEQIEKAVEVELQPQKILLAKNIEFCYNDENEKEDWGKILNFEEFIICDNKNKGHVLRQDYLYDQFDNNHNLMSNGVLPDYSDRDLDLIAANIDVFDVHHHYDTHNYLSKLRKQNCFFFNII